MSGGLRICGVILVFLNRRGLFHWYTIDLIVNLLVLQVSSSWTTGTMVGGRLLLRRNIVNSFALFRNKAFLQLRLLRCFPCHPHPTPPPNDKQRWFQILWFWLACISVFLNSSLKTNHCYSWWFSNKSLMNYYFGKESNKQNPSHFLKKITPPPHLSS